MTDTHRGERGPDVWSGDTWRADVVTWIDRQLSAAGHYRIGSVEQPRIRPWGTLLTVPTSAGKYWFKATAPETGFEVAIYPVLYHAAPDLVLEPRAACIERGWILLPDGGAHLTDVIQGADLVPTMASSMARYAELDQRRLAPQAETLIELGVMDMRPTMMRRRFDEALTVAGDYVDCRGTDDDHRTLEEIVTMRDDSGASCDRLAASAVPPSLDHNDLHPRNVLVRDASASLAPGARDARR